MMLAGIAVPPEATATLAEMVRPPAQTTSPTGSTAPRRGRELLALTLDERTIILDFLDDPPEGLVELRAVLPERIRVAAARGAGMKSFLVLKPC